MSEETENKSKRDLPVIRLTLDSGLQKALEAKTESIRQDLRKDLESNQHQ